MSIYNITLLKGDGIGKEIVDEATKVLNAVAQADGFEISYTEAVIGGAAIDTVGCSLPEETVEKCKHGDAILLGAVGGEKWNYLKGNDRPEAGLLAIRSRLELFANLRPAIIFESLRNTSPLKSEIIGENLDIMIVRELTGGIYFGERGRGEHDKNAYAYDTEKYSVHEIERIARVAFDTARKRKSRVTSVDKANVLESSRLWREIVSRIAMEEYADIELSHMYVDNAAMQLIRDPSQFDVIVTSNMFGDILSDEAAMISGSIGMLASASIGNGKLGLYEPAHGSAPDIAGKGIANPLATILSAAMMLKYSLNQPDSAKKIEIAVEKALTIARTPDIADKELKIASTIQMGDLVARLINS